MSDFEIHTERLLVRRFTPMDGSDFAGILTDPETVYYEPYEVFTREQAVAEAAMLAHNPAFYAVELNFPPGGLSPKRISKISVPAVCSKS